MSQKNLILNFMRKGRVVTPLIACRRLNCLSLSQRIGDLVDDGYDIKRTWIQKGNKRYRGYFLPRGRAA